MTQSALDLTLGSAPPQLHRASCLLCLLRASTLSSSSWFQVYQTWIIAYI